MASNTPKKNYLAVAVGFTATLALIYFGGKVVTKKIKTSIQDKESNDIDSNDPKVRIATQLAARALAAMDGSGTDENALNQIAVEIYRQGKGFFAKVSDSYKRLTQGRNLLNDIKEELSSSEFQRFTRCLNTGKYEADSYFDGIPYTPYEEVKPKMIELF